MHPVDHIRETVDFNRLTPSIRLGRHAAAEGGHADAVDEADLAAGQGVVHPRQALAMAQEGFSSPYR